MIFIAGSIVRNPYFREMKISPFFGIDKYEIFYDISLAYESRKKIKSSEYRIFGLNKKRKYGTLQA